MDRRDNPETPNSHSDEQFQRAYEVISLSYKGDEPERLYREAIMCFDSLIEISHGNETIREFAHRRSIDMKYLVDGASFVISKMHFNPENNYYITLGLPQHATPDELNRRWKKFMLLYHPDKQLGNEEWVSERAKKVNEAYTALKDETKRAEYDRRLTEQMLSQKFPSGPSHGTTYHRRPSGTFSRHRNREYASEWNRIRPYMSKILFVLYLLIALVVFGVIYLQNKSAHLEAELAPAPVKTESSEGTPALAVAAPNTAGAVEEHVSKSIPVMPVGPAKIPVKPAQEAKSSTAAVTPLQTIKGWFQTREKKQTQDKGKPEPEESSAALPEKSANRVPDNTGLMTIVPLKSSNAEQVRKEEIQHRHAEIQKVTAEQRVAAAEPIRPALEVKPPAPTQQKPEQITKEEVEEFMQRYVRAYTKNDLNTFMSLFSHSAVENNTLTYNEMRNAYKETFNEKINHYKILDMEIRTDGQTATVSGVYNVNRYLSAQDRWVRYSGKIVWKLIRENAQLRIVSTNYDK
ncbi:MAG: DnaJ domain-containing protein [Nitrospirae bacterium]|nr:DnaJ domain-containing protein [Nitrospirota bacterium]